MTSQNELQVKPICWCPLGEVYQTYTYLQLYLLDPITTNLGIHQPQGFILTSKAREWRDPFFVAWHGAGAAGVQSSAFAEAEVVLDLVQVL